MAIAENSVKSLMLEPLYNNNVLSVATGFVVLYQKRPYLITNWHVVSGQNADNDEYLSSHSVNPNALAVTYLLKASPADPNALRWRRLVEPLLDDSERPLWLEHPAYGRSVDVVALPLTVADEVWLMPYALDNRFPQLRAEISDYVNIIGFPFGVTGGGRLAIWTKGAIASEPEVDFNDLPCFLIDARTRQGQSGSPVVSYSPGGGTAMRDGSFAMFAGPVTNLLGIYSGRINKESDLGRVWKMGVIEEILIRGVRGTVGRRVMQQ